MTSRLTPIQQRLAAEHFGMANRIARSTHKRLARSADLDDVISSAMQGLVEAASSWDPNHGGPFVAFAAARIRGAILDGIRAQDPASRAVRAAQRQIEAYEDSLAPGTKVTPDQASESLGISRSLASRAMSFQHPAHLDEHHHDAVSTDVDTQHQALERQARVFLSSYIEALPEVSRVVLALHYYEGLQIRQIADRLQISEAKCSKVHREAVCALADHARTLKAGPGGP